MGDTNSSRVKNRRFFTIDIIGYPHYASLITLDHDSKKLDGVYPHDLTLHFNLQA